MRLFVAVEIDDDVRRVAEATAEELRRAIGAAVKARWVPAENMHLTVRFIGPVDDDLAPDIVAALTAPLDTPAFDIELSGCGVFPPHGPPRAIWIGVSAGLPCLAALHGAFDERLRPFGFEPEARPFSAHLTLARVRAAPRGAGRLVRAAVVQAAPARRRTRVQHVTLFESRLSPKGPKYHPVAFVPLSA